MFGAARANRRYKMFERLCRLDEGLIERFYAGNMRWRDQIKVLLGKLPVPMGNAVATLLGRGYPLTPLDSDASQSDLPG